MHRIAFAFIALALVFAGCVIAQQERALHAAAAEHGHAIGYCDTDSDCALHFGGDGSPRSR